MQVSEQAKLPARTRSYRKETIQETVAQRMSLAAASALAHPLAPAAGTSAGSARRQTSCAGQGPPQPQPPLAAAAVGASAAPSASGRCAQRRQQPASPCSPAAGRPATCGRRLPCDVPSQALHALPRRFSRVQLVLRAACASLTQAKDAVVLAVIQTQRRAGSHSAYA